MNRLAYLAFLLLGLIWGSNFLFMKWAAVWITPGQIVLLRIAFGFLPILLLAMWRGVLNWHHVRHLHHFVVMALLATAIYYFAFAAGTALLPSGIAGMLSGAIPLFSFVTAYLFLREEPLNIRTVGGLLLGFLGVLLIAKPWSGTQAIRLEGVLYMILGSLSVGSSFVYARRFLSNTGIPALALSTYQIGLALLMLLAVVDLHGSSAILADHKAVIGLALGLGLMGTGVAYVLYYYIVQHLGALKAAGVTYIPPVIALCIGHLVAHETLQLTQLLAVALILAGVYVLQRGKVSSK